jgi:protein-L-isoaspartate(D-aspartate) O-methyltransferase
LIKACPGLILRGLDISQYAISNGHPEVTQYLDHGTAAALPYEDNEFEFVFSINTLHNLHNRELDLALREIQRVGRQSYICVESYRNETEKANLLYWQVTCEQFNSPNDWEWWFENSKFTGDYSYIYFE